MAVALILSLYLCWYTGVSRAQSTSTNTPIPPLQWINLSGLLQGSTAPPSLRDVSLGYDETSRQLLVFGGESEGGFVQSQTYLLNLNTLTWSTPSPPANLDRTPPARSAAISGNDIAPSNRHAFIIIGGRGANGVALSDVWAFDFTNQFWSPVSPTHPGPSPRWGASGGIDIRVPPIQDSLLPGPNNTLYLAGGFDGRTMYPLSDVWRLNVSGTLSANLPDQVVASWEKVPVDRTLPSKVRQGGTIISQQIISMGGCSTTLEDDDRDSSCAEQDSYVVNLADGGSIAPGPCPVPRLDPVLVPNFNTYSTNFASQVFVSLGIYGKALWNDGGGLDRGEIDVLDVNTGTWTRILPAGDPGSTGQSAFPIPREGAAAFSYDRALVGESRNGISDTIIFGGRDASGRYLSDMWILRSYRDSVTSSTSQWSGYGDGRLQTGADANGAGVMVEYLTTCPSRNNPAQPPPPKDEGNTPSPGGSDSPVARLRLDTSTIHKLLSTVSLGLLLLSFLLLRSLPSSSPTLKAPLRIAYTSTGLLTLGAYGAGVAGFALSFTSLKVVQSNEDGEATAKHLSTPHSQVALAFFLCLYVVSPALLLVSFLLSRVRSRTTPDEASGTTQLRRTLSNGTSEKLGNMTPQTPSINGLYSSPPASPRPRTQSATQRRRSIEGMSTDGEESTMSGPPRRAFEVLNRPGRVVRSPDTLSSTLHPPQGHPSSRSLGDIDWLLRRRSLNAVGELDYALSMAHNAQRNSVATADPTSLPSIHSSTNTPDPPSFLNITAYLFTQLGFLGLNIITLIALWRHAHIAIFSVFLVCVVLFYILVLYLPRRFQSEALLFASLRGKRRRGPPKAPSQIPLSATSPVNGGASQITPPSPLQFPSHGHGPYLHAPPFSRAESSFGAGHNRPLSVEEDDDDDDGLDENTRQRMIEDEMSRRDVSIITMPKRKLWVANPS